MNYFELFIVKTKTFMHLRAEKSNFVDKENANRYEIRKEESRHR